MRKRRNLEAFPWRISIRFKSRSHCSVTFSSSGRKAFKLRFKKDSPVIVVRVNMSRREVEPARFLSATQDKPRLLARFRGISPASPTLHAFKRVL